MGARSITFLLLFAGIMLSIAGVYIIADRNVEVGYTTYFITIPEYKFETLMPGDYTRAESYALWLAKLERDAFEPVSWIYDVDSLPWRNCTGARWIGAAFVARLAAFYSGTPSLILDIRGCRGGSCVSLVSSDLLLDATTVKDGHRYTGKTEYRLQNAILDYDYFNITLTPVGLVVEDFSVASEVACSFRYRIDTPVLVIKGATPRVHHITVPTFFDTTWVRLGAALSALGVSVMILALAIAILQTRHPDDFRRNG